MKKITTLLFSGLSVFALHAQNKTMTTPQTALDFLTIPMDARAAGFGDMGVGTTPDRYAHQYNPAKYLFEETQTGYTKSGVFLSYSPWARNIVKDMNLTHIGGFYRFHRQQSLSASIRYFAMGDMDFTDENGAYSAPGISAYQMAVDVAYALMLSQYAGLSAGFRYALADLYPKDGYKKGWGVSGDVAFYFHRPLQTARIPLLLTLGASLADIGTKITFRDDAESYFMPLTFKLGAGLTGTLAENHKIMLAAEIQRSMVPVSEVDRERSSVGGFIASLGNGVSPGLGVGVEYGYHDFLFARMGYHHESASWSYRRYLALGGGSVYKIVRLDLAFLVSTGEAHDAINNTVRFSLAIDID
jgi:hypothetical protein